MVPMLFLLLEVMDKQLPVAGAFAWAGVAGVAGFLGGRRFGWRMAAPVLVVIGLLALYLLAQFADRFVGPATIAETGWWYPALSAVLIAGGIAATVLGAREHARQADAPKAGSGEGAV